MKDALGPREREVETLREVITKVQEEEWGSVLGVERLKTDQLEQKDLMEDQMGAQELKQSHFLAQVIKTLTLIKPPSKICNLRFT